MNILITGCAGFIGYHTTLNLSKNNNNKIVGIDNINTYYDEQLKRDRLNIIKNKKNFQFFKIDLKDKKKLEFLFKKFNFDKIIHLAAQAGVRYSFTNPKEYIDSNIGYFGISKKHSITHQMKRFQSVYIKIN